jgi:hypothetical protein
VRWEDLFLQVKKNRGVFVNTVPSWNDPSDVFFVFIRICIHTYICTLSVETMTAYVSKHRCNKQTSSLLLINGYKKFRSDGTGRNRTEPRFRPNHRKRALYIYTPCGISNVARDQSVVWNEEKKGLR